LKRTFRCSTDKERNSPSFANLGGRNEIPNPGAGAKPGGAGDTGARSTLHTTDVPKVGTGRYVQNIGTGGRDARIGKKRLLVLLQ